VAVGPAEATYQAAIWRSLWYYLTDPGLMAWGLGQFLFRFAQDETELAAACLELYPAPLPKRDPFMRVYAIV
jgi:hypothetical protein